PYIISACVRSASQRQAAPPAASHSSAHRESAMSRGPKRRAGERYPSGKLKPAGTPPAQIKRVVAMATRGAADVFLATQLGWLRLDEIITDTQAAAGVTFATLAGQHDAIFGLPRRAARSPLYETGFAGV